MNVERSKIHPGRRVEISERGPARWHRAGQRRGASHVPAAEQQPLAASQSEAMGLPSRLRQLTRAVARPRTAVRRDVRSTGSRLPLALLLALLLPPLLPLLRGPPRRSRDRTMSSLGRTLLAWHRCSSMITHALIPSRRWACVPS
jgi:hypothetical protein